MELWYWIFGIAGVFATFILVMFVQLEMEARQKKIEETLEAVYQKQRIEDDRKTTERRAEARRQMREAERKRGTDLGVYFNPKPEAVENLARTFSKLSLLRPFETNFDRETRGMILMRDAVSLTKAIVAATGRIEETHRRDLIEPLYVAALHNAEYPSSGITSLLEHTKATFEGRALEVASKFDAIYTTEYSALVGRAYIDLIDILNTFEIAQSPAKNRICQSIRGSIESQINAEWKSSSPGDANKVDDYTLLSVSTSCSDAELKSAWREASKQWHPDKLHGMAPELQQIATERLAAINNAYERIRALRML
jgi:DnaJ-domain-containing protein 1